MHSSGSSPFSRLKFQTRSFAVTPTGKRVDRPLTRCEITANEFRQKFGPLGQWSSTKQSPSPLEDVFKVWSLASKSHGDDYRACLHVLNTAYNFGVKIDDDLRTSTRLLALAIFCG